MKPSKNCTVLAHFVMDSSLGSRNFLGFNQQCFCKKKLFRKLFTCQRVSIENMILLLNFSLIPSKGHTINNIVKKCHLKHQNTIRYQVWCTTWCKSGENAESARSAIMPLLIARNPNFGEKKCSISTFREKVPYFNISQQNSVIF